MTDRNAYIERDRRGQERVVITTSPRRSSTSRTRLSNRELLNAAEEREEVLIIRNGQLENQLAWAQAQEQRAKEECGQLVSRLQSQVDATRRLQDRLKEEKDKVADLEERMRLMQRTSYESYRQRYEDLLLEVDDLRAALRQRDDVIRVSEVRLSNKTQTIVELKAHLRSLGYRVVGD
jgi:hypothetical protein